MFCRLIFAGKYFMTYLSLFELLKSRFANLADSETIPELGISLTKRMFSSQNGEWLPGSMSYKCIDHGLEFTDSEQPGLESWQAVDRSDCTVDCNLVFPYFIVSDSGGYPASGVIFLFHGLNEKSWNKYLPWAAELTRKTGKAVILFPIAFHMDRAAPEWSEPRFMRELGQARAGLPHNGVTSFLNAAISTRLDRNPERLFWSGCQTLADFKQMVAEIRSGAIPQISKSATVDLFGYSIGAFLGLFLLMADAGGVLGESRLFAFCGGATLDRMFPISKYIMDMRSAIHLQMFFTEQVHREFSGNSRMKHFIGKEHPEQYLFQTLLQYKHLKPEREARISAIASRIHAVALERDTVIPPDEVLNTLKGGYRNIPTQVEVLDFDYPYDHVSPFSQANKHAEAVNRAFQGVFDRAGDWLRAF